MNEAFRKIIEKAADSKSVAISIKEQGVEYLSSAVDKLPLLQSIAALSTDLTDFDETHYLLIPNPKSPKGYVVFTKRVIPAGHGANNSLPKKRIFHIPDASTREILVDNLIEQKARGLKKRGGADFADRLDDLADQIDQEAMRVSGGLLLIGGVVSFLNPIVGVGIALNALIPSVGSKATRAGAGLVGDKLRKWNESANKKRSTKDAAKTIKKLKPEEFINPVLGTLDALLTNESEDFDPFFDSGNMADEFEQIRYLHITLEGVHAVYDEVGNKKHSFNLSPGQEKWIRHLLELWEECE